MNQKSEINEETTPLTELKKEENIEKNNNIKENINSTNTTEKNNIFNNYGNIKILKYDKNNDPWLVLGPDYIYFFILIFLNLLVITFFAIVHYCYSSFIVRFFGMLLSIFQML